MVLLGIAKRGLGFIPAKSSPLSNRNYKMSEDHGRGDAGRKQPTFNRQPENQVKIQVNLKANLRTTSNTVMTLMESKIKDQESF